MIETDYTDPVSLQHTLESNHVEAVISTLAILTSNEAELNLVSAADASSCTRRFIPSSWGIPYSERYVTFHTQVHLLLTVRIRHGSMFPAAALKVQVLEKLKRSNLEYTRVNCGYFLDYWGMPKVQSFLQPSVVVLDLTSNVAGVPGSGNTPVVFTHTRDVANYASKLLDLPKWEPDSYVVGDRLTWNTFVELAEKTKGMFVRICPKLSNS